MANYSKLFLLVRECTKDTYHYPLLFSILLDEIVKKGKNKRHRDQKGKKTL